MPPERPLPREVTLRLEGVFDARAAGRAEQELARVAPEARVVLDLTAVGEFQDLAVAVLARALTAQPDGRVAVRGLRHHQARLLRYLGVAA